MDKSTLEHYKQKLLSLKGDYEQLEKSITSSNDLEISEREEYEELSFYDNHPADLGAEMYLREMGYAKLDNAKNTLNLINDALKRIDDNTYGICRICGKIIDKERLEAIPYSPYCIECEKKHEKLEAENTNFRPPEEIIFPHSFGDIDLDYKDENVEFDGEDTYQALERFNKTNDPSLQTGDQTEMWDDVQSGTVESTDNISSIYYKKLLEDEEDDNKKNEP
ncbi:MAG: TraR/DksA C4-type zinc finger protein [Thermoanaerobacteraceae bacterium]|nr:TraR/DksA C4-type zinc finger protein [Thermoanaerobacteraceae bacterium]